MDDGGGGDDLEKVNESNFVRLPLTVVTVFKLITGDNKYNRPVLDRLGDRKAVNCFLNLHQLLVVHVHDSVSSLMRENNV